MARNFRISRELEHTQRKKKKKSVRVRRCGDELEITQDS